MAIRINGDNTTAAPGITRGDDTDTGIQFGTDEVSIVTGGVERAKVDNVGRFDVNSGSSGVISAKQNTNNGGFNIYEGKDSAGSTKFYVTHNGRVGASEGVIFGTDTAAANILDDYEEGTFTPSFINYGSPTIGVAQGEYVKIGGSVFLSIYLDWSNGSPASSSRISGMPFAMTDSHIKVNGWGQSSTQGSSVYRLSTTGASPTAIFYEPIKSQSSGTFFGTIQITSLT